MRINLELPGRIRLPYRVRRWITSYIFHSFDELMHNLRRKGFFPRENYREEINRNTDVIEVWRLLPTRGHVLFHIMGHNDMDVGMVWVKVVFWKYVLVIQVEDCQETEPLLRDGFYSSYINFFKMKGIENWHRTTPVPGVH